jgi:hypothetical protein
MSEKSKGMQLVSTAASAPTISIEGWDAKDTELAALLETAANYLRGAAVGDTVGKELTFKQLDTGALFVVSHRS